MTPKTLDHVAFWLADREPIAELVTGPPLAPVNELGLERGEE